MKLKMSLAIYTFRGGWLNQVGVEVEDELGNYPSIGKRQINFRFFFLSKASLREGVKNINLN